jgi:hypothetical protein
VQWYVEEDEGACDESDRSGTMIDCPYCIIFQSIRFKQNCKRVMCLAIELMISFEPMLNDYPRLPGPLFLN